MLPISIFHSALKWHHVWLWQKSALFRGWFGSETNDLAELQVTIITIYKNIGNKLKKKLERLKVKVFILGPHSS